MIDAKTIAAADLDYACPWCNATDCPKFQKLEKSRRSILISVLAGGAQVEVPDVTPDDEYRCNYNRIFKK